jgi:hypothetical protein
MEAMRVVISGVMGHQPHLVNDLKYMYYPRKKMKRLFTIVFQHILP